MHGDTRHGGNNGLAWMPAAPERRNALRLLRPTVLDFRFAGMTPQSWCRRWFHFIGTRSSQSANSIGQSRELPRH